MADRVNFGRKRSDINQSQNTSLPKAPKLSANTKFTGQNADLFSKLEASILEKLTASNEYSRELTSRNTDAVMERIHSALAKLANELPENAESQAGLTAKDIESLKKEISDQIAKSDEKLSSTLKDYIQAQVSAVLNNETAEAPVQDISKLVDTLKTLFEQQSKVKEKNTGNIVVAEKSEGKEESSAPSVDTAKLDTSINNQEQLYKYLDSQFSQLHEKFQNLGDSFKNSSIFGFKNPLASVVGKITSPFKALSDSFKELGKKVGDGFKAVGKATLTALASPFKLIGAGLSALNPFKRKKKGPNDTKELLKLLKKMDKSFQSMEMVFTDFIGYLVKNFKTFLDKVSGVVEKFWLGLLLKTIVPTMLIIGAALYLLADPLMKVLQPVMDFVSGIVNKIIDFIAPLRDFILNNLQKIFDEVLHPLLRGIGTVAEDLGKALGKLVIGLADFAVDVLMPFLKEKVLPVLGVVLDLVKTFLEALEPWIKPLVDTIMPILLDVIQILGELLKIAGKIIIDIAKIIHAPIKYIADFFDGFGSNAKQIGVKVSEVVLKSLDIVLEVLDMIKNNIGDVMTTIRMYVIAPLAALKRSLNAFRVDAAKTEWSFLGNTFHPFAFLTSGMSKVEIEDAEADKGKSVSELLKDEMSKMSAKIATENEAKKLDELNKSLQQKNMQALLDNVNVIGDIYKMVKEIHADMFGQEHTDSLLAVQAVAPNLQTLQNVNAAYSAAGKSIAEDIDVSKQEAGDKQQGITLQGLYDAMKNMFEPVPGALEQILEKLDNPQVVPLPLSQPTNLAAMEDN